MKNVFAVLPKYIMWMIFLASLLWQNTFSQTVIGLDNWFNREIHPLTGEPFHYLWTDKEMSGYSKWGDIFISRGAVLKTIGKPFSSVLKNLDVYIIVDPDSTTESLSPNYILPDDIKTIKKWVKKGGVLAILANDAPNCEFTHLNMLASSFGMRFNHVTRHSVQGTDWEMGASTNLPDHALFKGVRKIYIKDVSDINLSGKASAILEENGKVLIAETCYGRGYVFAIGDPWIYNEYIDHDLLPESFDNKKAAENLTDLLLSFIKK